MKRRGGRGAPRKARSHPSKNGVQEEEEENESSLDEPQEKKGRKSAGRKPKKPETESEPESEELNVKKTSRENGNNQKNTKRKSKGRSRKKSESAGSDSESPQEVDPLSEDNTEYEVEAVLNEKFVSGVRHYLIRWKGYTEESDTWEPENTLDCLELINAYKQKAKKAGKKKREKKKSEGQQQWDEDEDFEVERIVDVYFHRDGTRDFLVSWKGYPSSQRSWEPEANMNCKDLIEKYMDKVNKAKQFEGKELRLNRKPVNRLEFSMHEHGRRLSKRHSGKDRVHYFDAE